MEKAAKNDLKWLHRDEWAWAERYLQERANSLGSSAAFIPRRRNPDYSGTVELIRFFEQHAAGLKLVERMKNALRQRRYRSPSNGKQACTFSLPNSTVKKLRRLAAAPGQTETSIVTELIDDLYSFTQEQQRKAKQLKGATQSEQKAAKQTNAMLKRQLDEAMKHLERHVELLVMWESSMETNHPPFNGDEADARREVEKRMKGIKRSLNLIAFKHDVVSERLI